jgi:hypothetical protein
MLLARAARRVLGRETPAEDVADDDYWRAKHNADKARWDKSELKKRKAD